MDHVAVSIIVPIYNVEPYLEDCLNSCVSQTLKNVEIICVDDASPDRCAQIIDRYAMSYPDKIIPVHLTENLRQGGARNVAIRMARGEFLCFVDGDDQIDCRMCEELYDIAIQNGRDIVCCDGLMLKDGESRYFEQINKEQLESLCSFIRFISQCYMIIKKRIIVDNDLFYPEKILYGEDTAVVPLWYSKTTSRELLKKPFYHQVCHSDSFSHPTVFSNQLQMIISMRILLDNAKKISVYEEYRPQLDSFIFSRILGFIKIRNMQPGLSAEEKALLHEEMQRWKNYVFEESLFYHFFTASEIRAVYMIIKSELIISPYEKEGNYFEDKDGRIQKLCQYVMEEQKRSIVVWGYGDYGKRIVGTLHRLRIPYIIGDNSTQLHHFRTDYGDVVRSRSWIEENVSDPFYIVAIKKYYLDVSGSLGLNCSNSIDMCDYIESQQGGTLLF